MSALDEMFPSGRPRVYGDTVVAPESAPAEAAAPPVPAAQVGAEAPIAPPSSARRDIFAQLGLPNSALERLDQAVARSDTATTDALAALADTRQQRAGVLEDMDGIERPGAPNIRDLPARPETPPRDNLRVFGQFLPVLAMLGGALNRNSATAALRAGTAALRAAQENDAEALARANAEWEQNVNAVLRQNDQAIQQFNVATTLYRTDIDGALAQLNALAAQEQNPVLQAQVAAGDLNAITGLFNARTAAYTAVSNAEAERQRINNERLRLTMPQAAEFGDTTQLARMYNQATADITTIENNYAQIQALAERAGVASVAGPPDIGLIFSYMKMLDPGSTVREGEYATAQNAGAVPDNVRVMFNRLIDGGRLDPRVRDEFVASARTIAAEAAQRRAQLNTHYAGVAQRNGINPADVVPGYAGAAPGGGAAVRLPPVGERVINRAYQMPDGNWATWDGQVFTQVEDAEAASRNRPGPDQ